MNLLNGPHNGHLGNLASIDTIRIRVWNGGTPQDFRSSTNGTAGGIQTIPEPASAGLLGLTGLFGLGFVRRRRKA